MTPFELIHQNNKTGELKACVIGNAIKNGKPLPLKNGSVLVPCKHSNDEIIDLFLNAPPKEIYNSLKNKRHTITGVVNNLLTVVKLSDLAKLTPSARVKFKMDIYQAELIDMYMTTNVYVKPDDLTWDIPFEWKQSICATAKIINEYYHDPELCCVTYHPIITRIQYIFKHLAIHSIQTFARWNAADAWLINSHKLTIGDVPDTNDIKILVDWMDTCFDNRILIPISFKKVHATPTLEVINPRDMESLHIQIDVSQPIINSLMYTVNSKSYTMQFRNFSKGHNIQASIKDKHVYHGKIGFSKLLEFLDIQIPSMKNMIANNTNNSIDSNWLNMLHSTQSWLVATILQEFTKYDQGVNTVLELHKYIMGLHIYCCKILKVS